MTAGARLEPPTPAAGPPAAGAVPPPRARAAALLLLAGAVLCAGLGQWQFAAGHAAFLANRHEALIAHRHAGLALYGCAVVLLAVLCRCQRRWPPPPPSLSRGLTAGILIALVGAGAFLRFHRLSELPPGLWVDEAVSGLAAIKIAERRFPAIVMPDDSPIPGMGAGFVDLAAIPFLLFDPADGPYALRAVSAVLGTIACAALGMVAWVLFGWRIALAATGWLCVSHYHVNYSRLGWEPITSSVVELLVLLGVLAGFRYRGWRSWLGLLAAGFCAGLGAYMYQNYRVLIVPAVALGLYLGVTRIRRVRERWPQLVAAGALALIVAAPMIWYAATHPEAFGHRASLTLVFSAPDWLQELRRSVGGSLLGFQLVGDWNPRHNLPFHPLLTFVPAMLAPFGLVVCWGRRDRLAYRLLPVWFVAALLPGLLTFEAPHASRLLDAVAPLALLVGVAVDHVCATLQAALPRGRAGSAMALVVVLVGAAVSARQEYAAYFIERERVPAFHDGFLPHEAVPGRYLEREAPAVPVYLDPKTYWSPSARFIARKFFNDPARDIRFLRLMHDFPPRDPAESDAVYLLPDPYTPLVPLLRALFPGAAVEELRDPFGRLDLSVCTVPRDDLNAVRRQLEEGTFRWPHGLLGRYYHTLDGSGAPYHEAVLPFIYCDYDIAVEPTGRFAFASWEGSIELPAPGEYVFRLNPDSTTLSIGGREILHHAGAAAFGGDNEGRATLEAGVFPIRITYQQHPNVPYFLWFWWHPPDGVAGWVPPSVLYPPDAGPAPADP